MGDGNLRIVLVGPPSSGKTAIALRYVRDSYDETQPATMGAAHMTKTITIKENKVKLEIWDTAG